MNEQPNATFCDHVGHWKAGGMAPLSNQGVIVLAQILYCENCGNCQVQLHKIVQNAPEPKSDTAVIKP